MASAILVSTSDRRECTSTRCSMSVYISRAIQLSGPKFVNNFTYDAPLENKKLTTYVFVSHFCSCWQAAALYETKPAVSSITQASGAFIFLQVFLYFSFIHKDLKKLK